jgi:hypothetical protein
VGRDPGVAKVPTSRGGRAFLDAIGMSAQPGQIVAEPSGQCRILVFRECFGAAQGLDAQRHFGQMQRVNPADAPAGAAAFDRLRIEQAGVYDRRDAAGLGRKRRRGEMHEAGAFLCP